MKNRKETFMSVIIILQTNTPKYLRKEGTANHSCQLELLFSQAVFYTDAKAKFKFN
jgi:hypothetical protein